MKKLNQSWRNQKDVPAQGLPKTAPSKESPKSCQEATTRRRLGRFPLVSRVVPTVRKIEPSNQKASSVLPVHSTSPDVASEEGSLPLSFISSGSWKADNELLAEMDKIEAAMNCDLAPTRDGLLTEECVRNQSNVASGLSESNHSTKKTSKASVISTGVGIKRKAGKQKAECVTKGVSLSSIDKTRRSDLKPIPHNGMLMRVSSPTSSPLDKRPKMNSRSPLQHVHAQRIPTRANPSVHKSVSSFATPEGRYYGRGRHIGSSVESNKEMENDISFSPLIETPKLSSDSSGEENEVCVKSGVRLKSSIRKPDNSNSSKRKSKTKVPLNVTETPRRSSARKRQSPKNLMSPDVKIPKPTRNKLSLKDESLSGANEVVESQLQNKGKLGKKTSGQLKLNCIESQGLHLEDKDLLNIESQSSSIAPSISSSFSTSTTPPIRNVTSTSMSANTTVNTSLTEDKRLLKSWGLPGPVLAAYQKQGVTTMFEWQAECLLSPSVLDGGNLIYSAPTSAGKTLVAEILVMKRVLETRKRALIILPFVSVAREKMFSLQRLYQDAGIRVGGFMGSHSPAGGLSALDVAVCTIEKGNGLVNRMMEDGRIDDIGVVVVDELHMVGDSHRGYLLELMLTKLQFLSLRRESDHRLQIIGMSATLPNLEVLAKWLRAALYRTDFRPVPLSEHIKIDNRIYDSQLVPQRDIPARFISPDDTDHILALCLETVMSNHSVLLFCPTKNWCEKLCETIARRFYHITHSQAAASGDAEEAEDSHNKLTLNTAGLRESLEQLRRCPVGVDPMLGRCLINGVAYHHAGLTFDERDIVEGAFRESNLRVLVATSTLSSGVNLPARRVIIRTPMFHGQVIDVLTFKQMSGRAGRKGVDTEGESILICKPSEKTKGRTLLQSELPPVESCLYFDDESGLSRSLKRAILEVVVSGVAPSPEDVMSYIKCTLLSASMDDGSTGSGSGPCTASLIENCITFLQDNEFVSMQTVKKEDGTECEKFFPTQLGSAILASSLSPDEGLLVFAELQKARRSFVLESELHVIYLVTPVYTTDIATSIDWYHYYTLWENLSPAERRVADLVGIREGFIAQAIGGRINKKTEGQRKAVAVHHRFYTSLVLSTLVREVPLMEVAAKFNLNKGQLQSLQQSAATYTGMLTVFCQRLGWHNLELILSRFQRRLSMGVQHELVDLVRISALAASSARMLYNAGYHSVADVARAGAIEVEELFKKAVPFQSDKKQDGETDWERKERQKAKCIWLTGRKGMTELDAAKEIIHEAKGIVQGDLGVRDIAWNSKDDETMTESSNESENEEEEDACIGRDTQGGKTEDAILQIGKGIKLNNKEAIPSTSHHDLSNVETNNEGNTNFTGPTGKEICSSVLNEKHLKNHASPVAKVDPVGPSLRSQRLVGGTDSGQNRNTRRVSCGKRRKSVLNGSRNKGSETSFFGQVVVTPPPGLRSYVDENKRNQSKACDDNSLDSICNVGGTSAADTQNGRNKLQEPSQHVNRRCGDHNITNDMRSGNVTNNLNKSSYSKKEEVENIERHHLDVGGSSGTHRLSKSIPPNAESSRKVLPTPSGLLLIEYAHMKDSEVTVSCPKASEMDKKGVIMTSGGDDVVIDSHNTSTVSDNLSFSESFILDTQTAALISEDCQEYMTSGQGPSLKDTVENKSNAGCVSRNELLPLSSRSTRRSMRKSSFKPNDEFDEKMIKDSMQTSVAEKDDIESISLSDHSSESVSFFEPNAYGRARDGGQHGRPENIQHDASIEMPHLDSEDTRNMSLNLQEPLISQGKEIGADKDEDKSDCDDEPDSFLVASCYERVSNFDEGMLECSGYDDLGIDNSLSELNIVRNTCDNNAPRPSCSDAGLGQVQEINSNSNLLNSAETELLSLTSKNSYRNVSGVNHMSDTQCIDDSLLAAMDLGGFTPLSSHREKNAKSDIRDNEAGPQYAGGSIKVHTGIRSKTHGNGRGETRQGSRSEPNNKVLQSQNKVHGTELKESSESNMFLSDSLSASLVDQAFAQCNLTSLKTSSPCTSNNNTNSNLSEQSKGHKPLSQNSSHTTPVSKHSRSSKRTGGGGKGHIDISPVLWDNPDSNTNSLNNSSCHDGSDCVPPTPPDETSSHASPLKLAFLSPMTNRKKTNGPSKLVRQTADDQGVSISTAVKQLPWFNRAESSNGASNSMFDCLNEPLNENVDVYDHPSPADVDDHIPITSQSQLFTQQSFTIIDVCAHPDLFKTFFQEWRSKPSCSLALACEKMTPAGKGKTPTGIGSRFNKRKSAHHSLRAADVPAGLPIPNADVQLVGVAVTWEHRDAYYLSLVDAVHKDQESDPDDSLAEPSLCESISLQDRIDAVVNHLHTTNTGHDDPQTMQIYDTKTAYSTLAKTLGVSLAKCEDPRVADWLKEPGSRLKNLHRMVTTYLPDELALLEEVGGGSSYQGLGFDVKSRVSGRIRSCTESILTRKLMVEYRCMLGEQELWQAFEKTEMPALLTLCRMELNGFGINMPELESQKSLMKAKLESIEQTAYKMAGHVFSLTSLDDIAKILYLELKLPLNGDPDAVPYLPARGTRHRRAVGGTSKEILEKLTKYHPLPALVLEWRRISSALTKSLFALQRTARHCNRVDMTRVFGDCQIFSATGRVAMAEPNIQNIPKDFCVELKELQFHGESSTSSNQVLFQSVSMRKMFVPFTGGVILSADYSQLELRIIAHLSGDSKLSRILNSDGGDVFKLIAAQFKSMDVEEVTATDRQQAKQVCYGMLYGIGPKALGEQIGVCENEATVFMETFKSTYPGIRKYLRETVEFCQKNGYVKTLFNRRRYLPSIKHTNPHARAQAERQAVNTSVQGSAADLVKKAMTEIDLRLMEMFPDCLVAHSQGRAGASVAAKTGCDKDAPQGGFFLLQLHDELIYEVNAGHLDVVARLVKKEMEGACRLCVRMPVKLNVGPSWGQLKEFEFG